MLSQVYGFIPSIIGIKRQNLGSACGEPHVHSPTAPQSAAAGTMVGENVLAVLGGCVRAGTRVPWWNIRNYLCVRHLVSFPS